MTPTAQQDSNRPIHDAPFGLALALLLATSSCNGRYRIPETPSQVRDVVLFRTLEAAETIDRLVVKLHGGSVLLQPAAKSPTGETLAGDVRVAVGARTHTAAASLLAAAEVVEERSGSTLNLHIKQPSGVELSAFDTSYRLQVPASITVQIQGADARVAIRGYGGRVEASTGVGEIHARLSGGTCRLESRTGSVRLEGRFQTAEIFSGRGDVSVVLPPTEFPPAELDVETETAPITLELAECCRAKLSFVTREGRLQSESPLRWNELGQAFGLRNRWQGEIGAREAEITAHVDLETASGLVRVRRLPSYSEPNQESGGSDDTDTATGGAAQTTPARAIGPTPDGGTR